MASWWNWHTHYPETVGLGNWSESSNLSEVTNFIKINKGRKMKKLIPTIGLILFCSGCTTVTVSESEVQENRFLNERISGDPLPETLPIYQVKF